MRSVLFFLLMLSLMPSFAMMRPNYPQEANDGPPQRFVDASKIPNAIPKVEPKSRYGNPSSYVVFGERYHVLNSAKNFRKRGIASWYGTKFHEQRTSSGEPYDMFAMTAANKILPLPTYVKVTNLENGKQIIVKVNDRGPFKENRIIDLSYVAAKKLGILATGTGLVEVEAIDPRHYSAATDYKLAAAKSSLHPKIYMQIGAFSSAANAENLRQAVNQITNRRIRVVTVTAGKHTFYKVQIGPLANVDESDALNHKLSHLDLGKPMTVID